MEGPSNGDLQRSILGLQASIFDLTEIVSAGFDRFEKRFDATDQRISELDYRVNTRIDNLQEELNGRIDSVHQEMRKGFADCAASDGRLSARIDSVHQEVRKGFAAVDGRFRRLRRPGPKRR